MVFLTNFSQTGPNVMFFTNFSQTGPNGMFFLPILVRQVQMVCFFTNFSQTGPNGMFFPNFYYMLKKYI